MPDQDHNAFCEHMAAIETDCFDAETAIMLADDLSDIEDPFLTGEIESDQDEELPF